MRDSFVFYRSFYEALLEVDAETRAQAIDALCQYALNDTEPTLNGAASMFFKLVKPQVDANNRRHENGMRGGRPKTKTEPNENQTITKSEPNVNVNVNDNDIKKKNIKKKSWTQTVESRPYDFEALEAQVIGVQHYDAV